MNISLAELRRSMCAIGLPSFVITSSNFLSEAPCTISTRKETRSGGCASSLRRAFLVLVAVLPPVFLRGIVVVRIVCDILVSSYYEVDRWQWAAGLWVGQVYVKST